jgi:hypothetical protein
MHSNQHQTDDTTVESQAPEMRPFHIRKQSVLTVNLPKACDADCQVLMAKQSKKTEKLMRGIDTFFSNAEHMGKLLPFLVSSSAASASPSSSGAAAVAKTRISLRLIEWFVTDHCMRHAVDWFIEGEFFNVFLDYQNMMNEYKKKRFDPFGRKWRKEIRRDLSYDPPREHTVQVYHGIRFFYTETDYVITTVAQLNFFRWLIEKRILDYIIDHRVELTKQMSTDKVKKRKQPELEIGNAAPTEKTGRVLQQQQLHQELLLKSNTLQQQHTKPVQVRATKRVTKKTVEVFVSFD